MIMGRIDDNRREFLQAIGASIVVVACGPVVTRAQETQQMYGLIGKLVAAPGQRDPLVAILLENVAAMPGCLSYVIAKDATDPNAIWITEVWDNQASHQASLTLPSVREAIARGKPLIAGFGERFITEPVGGHGLAVK
jgi:quinol monooxygenase YgiN